MMRVRYLQQIVLVVRLIEKDLTELFLQLCRNKRPRLRRFSKLSRQPPCAEATLHLVQIATKVWSESFSDHSPTVAANSYIVCCK